MTQDPGGKPLQDHSDPGTVGPESNSTQKSGKALEALKKKYEQAESPESRTTLFQYWKKARLWFYGLLVCFVLYGIRPYTTYKVPSDATNMHSFFPPGTTVLINKDFRPPQETDEAGGGGRPLQYRDCVLYEYSHAGRVVRMMGRVVALPRDRVLVKSGKLLLNGEDLTEPYLTKAVPERARSSRNGETVVPSGSVFVLNDDRANGILDSRDFGPVKAEQIVGKIVISNHW